MDKSTRRKAKYGKKGSVLSSASAEIFGREATPEDSIEVQIAAVPAKKQAPKKQEKTRPPLEDLTDLLKNVTLEESKSILTPSSMRATSEPQSCRRSPRRKQAPAVDDIAELLSTTHLKDHDRSSGHSTPKRKIKSPPYRRSPRRHAASTRTTTTCQDPASSKSDPRLKWLKPLVDAYQNSGSLEKEPLSIQKWDSLLDDDWILEKIAESSYAEVFKVSNEFGTSILKLLALRPPKGPGSQRETAIPVEMVISEVLIMNMMADLDGYVEFKEAHIIEGRPPKALTEAFDNFAEKKETFFPRPTAYQKGQLFLALELGDAGTDVEHFNITTPAQLWDIFLGVVTALATGEQAYAFEHRDLHEGNVCLRQVSPPTPVPKGTKQRIGYSGLEVTLLDYTLSRAETPNSTIIHLDLETDPEVFAESDILQRQIYRRMRNWVFFRTHGTTHPLFDNSEEAPQHGSWEFFEPYTNVIWLWYILDYTIKHFKGEGWELRGFLKETEELRMLLHPDRRAYDGGFEDALGVYDYCLDQGWIPEEEEDNEEQD